MPTTDPSISVGKSRELLQQTDKLIALVPEVRSVHGKIGRAETATDPAPLSMIETVVQLEPDREKWRKRSVERFFDDWPKWIASPLSHVFAVERPITMDELVRLERRGRDATRGIERAGRCPDSNAWPYPIENPSTCSRPASRRRSAIAARS
jgi:hypothetical protein